MINYYIHTTEGEIVSSGYTAEDALPKVPSGMTLVTGAEASPMTHYVEGGELKRFTHEERGRRERVAPGRAWSPRTRDWVDTIPPQARVLEERRKAYPPVADQLDALWNAMDQGVLPKIEPMYSQIKAVKEKYPKPQNGR